MPGNTRLLKLIQEEIENINRYIVSREIELVIEYPQKAQTQIASLLNSTKHLMFGTVYQNSYQFFTNFSKNRSGGKTLGDQYYPVYRAKTRYHKKTTNQYVLWI